MASEVANRKIFDLELELQELKENEMHSWAQYRPLSLLFKPEPSSATEDYEILIEGFLYLIDQYSYRDSEIKSENIEKAQRIIIKTLFSRQKLLESDEKVEKITFFPSREEDRKIWYVEVLGLVLYLKPKATRFLFLKFGPRFVSFLKILRLLWCFLEKARIEDFLFLAQLSLQLLLLVVLLFLNFGFFR